MSRPVLSWCSAYCQAALWPTIKACGLPCCSLACSVDSVACHVDFVACPGDLWPARL
jgi:hypothetical protein